MNEIENNESYFQKTIRKQVQIFRYMDKLAENHPENNFKVASLKHIAPENSEYKRGGFELVINFYEFHINYDCSIGIFIFEETLDFYFDFNSMVFGHIANSIKKAVEHTRPELLEQMLKTELYELKPLDMEDLY